MKMIGDMRLQFLDLLSDIGFVDKSKGANVSIFITQVYYANIPKNML